DAHLIAGGSESAAAAPAPMTDLGESVDAGSPIHRDGSLHIHGHRPVHGAGVPPASAVADHGEFAVVGTARGPSIHREGAIIHREGDVSANVARFTSQPPPSVADLREGGRAGAGRH